MAILSKIKFNEFYDKNIKKYAEEVKELENELFEFKILKNFIIVVIALLLIAAAIVIKMFNEKINLLYLIIIYIFAMSKVIKIGGDSFKTKEKNHLIKSNTIFMNGVLPEVVKFIGEDLIYNLKGITYERVKQSKLFLRELESFHSKTLIHGYSKGLSIELAHIVTTTASNVIKKGIYVYVIYSAIGWAVLLFSLIGLSEVLGGIIAIVVTTFLLYFFFSGRKNYDNEGDVFAGIFFSIDFNKEFNSITVVKPDNVEKKLGEYGRVVQEISNKNGLELARLENIEFEKEFMILTNNQQDARYILTPNLMEKLVKLEKEKNVRAFSFVDGRINMAIEDNGVNQIVFEKESLYDYCSNINRVFEIIDILDLNTRIWTKE